MLLGLYFSDNHQHSFRQTPPHCPVAARRFRDEGDDRRMVASRAEIEAEERRSARAARGEDERAAAEEARAAAAKAAKKKKRRRGDSSFMLA